MSRPKTSYGNLCAPWGTPPPELPIKEIPREHDRYELLELDKVAKNSSQKELTFEGCWFTYIELN